MHGGTSSKAKLDTLRKRQETDAILSTLLAPQYHSSYKTAAELLYDPRHNGESVARRHLRERFAFHQERQRPTHRSAPASLSAKPNFLEPLRAKDRAAQPHINLLASDGQQSDVDRRQPQPRGPSILSSSTTRCSPALAEYVSLQAVRDAFAPRWRNCMRSEQRQREEIQRDHSVLLESILKDLSRTIDIEKMVRPEVAASLGLTINVKLPNYLEEEKKLFNAALSALLKAEVSNRESTESILLREFAALRRRSVRQLRALTIEHDARIAAAAQEVAQQQEMQRVQLVAHIQNLIDRTVGEEVVQRFVEVEIAEFTARHELDFHLNAEWGTAIRVARKSHFNVMIAAHNELCSEEKQNREFLEAEEKKLAVGELRDCSAALDRVILLDSIDQRMQKLVAQETQLRAPRDGRLLMSHVSSVVENGAVMLQETFVKTIRKEMQKSEFVANAEISFAIFCEEEDRASIFADWSNGFEEIIGKNLSGPSSHGAAARSYADTPTSDVMDPSANRSAVSSRQQTARRPLWSAGGNSERASRVPTPDANTVRGPRVVTTPPPSMLLRSRQSSALGSRGVHPPLPKPKMDL